MNRNKILSAGAVVLVLSLSYFFFTKKTSTKLSKYSNYLSCQGYSFDVNVKFQGTVLISALDLPESEQEKNEVYYGAAYYQNMFTFAQLTENNATSALKWISFNNRPKIKILKAEDTTYPHELDLKTSTDVKGFPPIEEAYLNRLIERGAISKGSKAKLVSYEYDSPLYVCLDKPDLSLLNEVKYITPIDPFTAYFQVPSRERRLVKGKFREAIQKINPCADSSMVSYKEVSPWEFWFYWRPEQSGHDFEKNAFNCQDYYKVGDNLISLKPSFSENPQKDIKYLDFAAFEKLERPIKAMILFGAMDNSQFKKFDIEEVKELVRLYTSDIPINEAKKLLPTKRYDTNFQRTLILLWNISKHMRIINSKVDVEELSLNILLQGKLKLSNHDFQLKIALSPNSAKDPGVENFDRNMTQELLNNDIFIYEGHTGHGQIFNRALEKIKENKAQYQDKSVQYQILALYSCISEFYYKPDQFPRIDNDQFKRDIIYTGGGYADFSVHGSLAIIASLDSFLYNGAYVPFGHWAKSFKSDNFYILTND